LSSLSTSYLLGVATKKSLRYGFHYTWPGLSPESNIVVVHAPDLEEARTLVRARVAELYPGVNPTCHWITMPADFDHNPPRGQLAADAQVVASAQLAETTQIRQQHIWRTPLKIILVTLIAIIVVGLMSSCNVDRFIQCNKKFTRTLTEYELKLSGARVYRLEPIPRDEPYRLPPTRPE